jgi:hypothetical protein
MRTVGAGWAGTSLGIVALGIVAARAVKQIAAQARTISMTKNGAAPIA